MDDYPNRSKQLSSTHDEDMKEKNADSLKNKSEEVVQNKGFK